jgi:2-dehydropantoate 2-reductase
MMKKSDLKIVVVGAGAIGGVSAAFMKKGGWDPILVCKHLETLAQVEKNGIHITGIKGGHTVPMNAVQSIAELPEGIDICFLATKANDCVTAARALLPFLRPESVLVSLQNGICEEALAEVVGRQRVIGCVVGWGATHLGPGHLEVTSEGEFVIGPIDHRPDDRLSTVKAILEAVQPTRISANILGELYSKLIINSSINSLGVITGATLGKLLAVRKIRSIFIELMREAMAVADAMGIKVEATTGGRLDYCQFLAGSGPFQGFKRHLIIRVIGFKYRRIKSSSLQSLERGRLTEIDFLNGYICEKARQHEVPVPINEAVVTMVKEIEAGRRPRSMTNIEDKAFVAF